MLRLEKLDGAVIVAGVGLGHAQIEEHEGMLGTFSQFLV